MGGWQPSSDAPTHLVLYREFPEVGAVVHTHSRWATAWAQAERPIPALGTTHADYFGGEIPCTRPLTAAEIEGAYEEATGAVIVEAFAGVDAERVPGVLVARHGPFAWGDDPASAVENAQVLEEVAALALHTVLLAPDGGSIDSALLDRHFLRKRGPGGLLRPARGARAGARLELALQHGQHARATAARRRGRPSAPPPGRPTRPPCRSGRPS